MRPERMVEMAEVPRNWQYDEILDICRRILDKHMEPDERGLYWSGMIYNFAQDILESKKEHSRNEIKKMFKDYIIEHADPQRATWLNEGE